ncbi:hypothetical protein GCM10011415_02310 [Salipiger pallidus]|uniref:Uncharacterized protein n=1 Tax=Salipiger pallidus TaxID=1775170 RepID=A0A8J2ZGI9_9RHOB|nr:hypothetical protein GCM10011415_02310 [Salipiger pallidus]
MLDVTSSTLMPRTPEIFVAVEIFGEAPGFWNIFLIAESLRPACFETEDGFSCGLRLKTSINPITNGSLSVMGILSHKVPELATGKNS